MYSIFSFVCYVTQDYVLTSVSLGCVGVGGTGAQPAFTNISELQNIVSNNGLHDRWFKILLWCNKVINYMLVNTEVKDNSVFNVVQNNNQIEEEDYDEDINIPSQINNEVRTDSLIEFITWSLLRYINETEWMIPGPTLVE